MESTTLPFSNQDTGTEGQSSADVPRRCSRNVILSISAVAVTIVAVVIGLVFGLQGSSSPAPSPSPSSSLSPCTIYVSPGVNALHNAQLAARNASQNQNGSSVVICFSAGTYSDVPLYLNASDTPRPGGRVIWRSTVPGGAVIDGGTQLQGWIPVNYSGGSVYMAQLPAPVAGAATHVRQLWVAGTRAVRVFQNVSQLLGNLTMWNGSGGIGFVASQQIPAFLNVDANATAAMEFTWPIVVANWIAPRCTIASINFAANNISLRQPCGTLLLSRAGGLRVPPPVYMEAVPGVALSPGQFYHNFTAGTVYYALATGQSLADLQSTAFTTFTETLIAVNNASLHTFEGFVFTRTTWAQPNANDGFVDAQSTVFVCSATPGCHGQIEPEGSVAVSRSSNISFLGCKFIGIGSAYALSVDRGSQFCTIAGNTFTDLSGGFVKLGSVVATNYASGSNASWDAYSVVEDNIASNMAVEIQGAAGLFAGYVHGVTIQYNSIADAGYSGISLGWGWGISGPLAGHGGNRIIGNQLNRVMTKLRDGGGIYVNGLTQPATQSVIQGNFVQSDQAVFAAIYLDNGASWYWVTQNVVANSSLVWAFFMQGCCNLPASNSQVDNLWWQLPMLAPRNNCAAQNCTVNNATIVQVAASAALPAAAQAIVQASGARPARVAGYASGSLWT